MFLDNCEYMRISEIAPLNATTGERQYPYRGQIRVRSCGRGSQQYCYRTMAPVTELYQRGVIWS